MNKLDSVVILALAVLIIWIAASGRINNVGPAWHLLLYGKPA